MAFRWKLFLAYLCLLITALFLFSFWTERRLRASYLDNVETELEREVQILTVLLDVGNENLDAQVDAAVGSAGRRLTVIESSGRVIADSSFSGPRLQAMDNHATRPEIVQARRQGVGSSLRFSNSVKEDLLYVARFLPEKGVFIRVATQVAGIEQTIADLRKDVAVRAFLLMLAGFPVAFALARHFSRPLRDLKHAAEGIAAGTSEDFPVLRGSDEVAHLSRTLHSMSQQIRRQLLELESEGNHLKAILHSMEEGVMVTDGAGKITAINPSLRRILDLEEEPVGKNPLEVFRSVEVNAGIHEALGDGNTSARELEADGKHLVAYFAPIRRGESVRGVVTVFHDVTELRRLERARRDFVGNVSHELRTPLTSIAGYSETLLQTEGLNDLQKKFVAKIHANALHLKEIVNELLELSRLENRKLQPTLSPVLWEKLEQDLRQDFETVLARKGDIELVFHNELKEPVFAAPAAHLMRILTNLLDNSFKYTDKGRVEVRLQRRDSFLHFTVSDTGIGIAGQDIDRVFERFYRGVQARSEGLGGTGLGLSIVKHVVELLGGEIWIESQLKKGTTVHFTIPGRQDGEPQEAS